MASLLVTPLLARDGGPSCDDNPDRATNILVVDAAPARSTAAAAGLDGRDACRDGEPFCDADHSRQPGGPRADQPAGNRSGDASTAPATVARPTAPPRDVNRAIYHRNKIEFSVEGGWLPINIPFVFDFLLGGGYNVTGLNYTLVPIISSLRWQLSDIAGPKVLRGNWEAMFGGVATAIPRGPETHFIGYTMGVRRNFVPRNWRAAPYLDGRVGIGNIDAKGPKGAWAAQGQDLTFTLMLGSGVRYNFNPRWSISAGLNYMHISNLYLSEPKYPNYGINVYGPMFGINMQLGRRPRQSAHVQVK